jgi:hypothetical protein
MPEQKSARRNGASGRQQTSARDVAQRVREDLPELLGKPVESILGIKRTEDGWEATAAVVELARIPNSTDVLGAYRVTLDSDGELEGYERVRRYNRSQADED